MSKLKAEPDHERICLKVNNRIFRRLQRHIAELKYAQDLDLSQHEWIKEAISEKLQKDLCEPSKSNAVKQLTVRLERELKERIDQAIERIKSQTTGSYRYSKSGWVLEAIEDKLERETEQKRLSILEKLIGP